MARRMDQRGGGTRDTNIVDGYHNLTLAVLLPRGCLAGYRRLRYSADDLFDELGFTSLARRLNVCDFGLMKVLIDNSGQSELLRVCTATTIDQARRFGLPIPQPASFLVGPLSTIDNRR